MASSSSSHGYPGSELPPSSADSQPPEADQPEVRHDLSSETVFRLQILGKRNWEKSPIDEARVEQLVRKAFDVTPDAKIIVKSLADHPVRQALVATLNFSRLPTRISQTSPSLQDFGGIVEDLSLDLDTHFHGFTPLHSNTSSEYTCDFIALSGLGGHAFGSFKRRGGDFMWLRDDLPVSIPDARVFVYGYDSRLQDSYSFQSLEDLGLSFKNALKSLLKENWKRGFLKPLVLLAHSLGGLVVKEALCQMSANPKIDEEFLLKSLRAVLFFGTPNQGMDIASLIPMVQRQANEEFLRSLGPDSADLRRQAQQWSRAFDSAKLSLVPKSLEITSYYETSTSRTAVKIDGKWKMSGPPAKLVDRFSATHGRAWDLDERFVQPIDRDHSELVKFRGRNDPVYVSYVLPRLQSYMEPMSTRNEHNLQRLDLTDKQKACLSSLQFPDRISRQDQVMTARDNTCEWLLEHQTYRSWLQGNEGLLWLEGHPGTGKSTLTKHAVQAIKTNNSSRHVVFTHFFHGRGTEMQKSALGLVRSLTYQLLNTFPVCWSEIMTKWEETEHPPTWSLEWLGSFLEIQLRQACTIQPIALFIDALDECEERDRDYLGDFLADTVRGSIGANLKIFVSCRHYPNLFSEGFRISTEFNNADDISVFVSSKLQIMQENKRSVLAKEIINNARGNFQWSKIVTLESAKLHRKGHTAAYIQETIQQLPKDIHELYDSLFKDADPDDLRLAHRLFQWLCFAKRPLSVRELQHIIMLSPETKESSIEELCQRTDFREELRDMANTIIDISRGLAEILISEELTHGEWLNMNELLPDSSSEANTRDEMYLRLSWTSQVQFIHQTVIDYLLDTGLQTVKGTRHAFSRGQSNYFITRSCLCYITMHDFADETKLLKMITNGANTPTSRNALQPYISGFLGSHLVDVDAGGIDQSDFIVHLHWPYDKFNFTNLAIALDREPFIEAFLGGDISSIKWSYGTLLQWSAEVGSAGVVKSIIKRKFDQDQQRWLADGGLRCTIPLDSKIWGNQNVFINGYFNVNLRNPSGSALDCAIAKSHDTVVRELMESPIINPNFQDSMGETPLHHASTPRVMAHLLKHPKINTRLQCHQGKTALFPAVDTDNLEILRMYIEAASECVNMKDWIFEDTPLSYAVTWGQSNAVMMFINHGNCTKETLQHAFDIAQFMQYRLSGRRKKHLQKCVQLLVQTGLVIVE